MPVSASPAAHDHSHELSPPASLQEEEEAPERMGGGEQAQHADGEGEGGEGEEERQAAVAPAVEAAPHGQPSSGESAEVEGKDAAVAAPSLSHTPAQLAPPPAAAAAAHSGAPVERGNVLVPELMQVQVLVARMEALLPASDGPSRGGTVEADSSVHGAESNLSGVEGG
jgi:hypothetical protein